MAWNGFDISLDTARMLDELIQRKRKLEKAEGNVIFTSAISIASLILFYISYGKLVAPLIIHSLDVLTKVVGNPLVFSLLLTMIVAFLFTASALRKAKEAKNKFETLRKEAVAHLRTTWQSTPKSMEKDKLTAYLKHQHKINVSYIG